MFIKKQERKGLDSQGPHSKDGRQAPLLYSRHVQAPNGGNGNDQDHQIGGNIDHARADKHCVLVNALASCGNDVVFAEAFESDGEHQSNGVEEIPPEHEPDGPPDGSPAYT